MGCYTVCCVSLYLLPVVSCFIVFFTRFVVFHSFCCVSLFFTRFVSLFFTRFVVFCCFLPVVFFSLGCLAWYCVSRDFTFRAALCCFSVFFSLCCSSLVFTCCAVFFFLPVVFRCFFTVVFCGFSFTSFYLIYGGIRSGNVQPRLQRP